MVVHDRARRHVQLQSANHPFKRLGDHSSSLVLQVIRRSREPPPDGDAKLPHGQLTRLRFLAAVMDLAQCCQGVAVDLLGIRSSWIVRKPSAVRREDSVVGDDQYCAPLPISRVAVPATAKPRHSIGPYSLAADGTSASPAVVMPSEPVYESEQRQSPSYRRHVGHSRCNNLSTPFPAARRAEATPSTGTPRTSAAACGNSPWPAAPAARGTRYKAARHAATRSRGSP